MRTYVDAAPVIYYIEQSPVFAPKVNARLKAPGVQLISSHLTRMETLVFPIRSGNAALRQDFEDFFRMK